MLRKLFLLSLVITFLSFSALVSKAQTSRKAVSAAEASGTFRYSFTGKFKGSANEIDILALGQGRLKVAFNLIYPFIDGTGGLMANSGQAEGEATIVGDTAVFTDNENEQCRISIKFVKPGIIRVTQKGDSAGCGFGLNVLADGTYKKVSGAKPKFE